MWAFGDLIVWRDGKDLVFERGARRIAMRETEGDRVLLTYRCDDMMIAGDIDVSGEPPEVIAAVIREALGPGSHRDRNGVPPLVDTTTKSSFAASQRNMKSHAPDAPLCGAALKSSVPKRPVSPRRLTR